MVGKGPSCSFTCGASGAVEHLKNSGTMTIGLLQEPLEVSDCDFMKIAEFCKVGCGGNPLEDIAQLFCVILRFFLLSHMQVMCCCDCCDTARSTLARKAREQPAPSAAASLAVWMRCRTLAA